MFRDPPHQGKTPHVAAEPLRIVNLWDQTTVRQPRFIAPAARAGVRAFGQHALEGGKALAHPVIHPGDGVGIVCAESGLQVLLDAQVVDRVDVGGHRQGHGPHLRAVFGQHGQQRRLGEPFLQPFADGERLGDDLVSVYQHRHQPLGIEFPEGRGMLFTAAPDQVHRPMFVRQALQVQRDAHPVGGGTAPVAEQFQAGGRFSLHTAR